MSSHMIFLSTTRLHLLLALISGLTGTPIGIAVALTVLSVLWLRTLARRHLEREDARRHASIVAA